MNTGPDCSSATGFGKLGNLARQLATADRETPAISAISATPTNSSGSSGINHPIEGHVNAAHVVNNIHIVKIVHEMSSPRWKKNGDLDKTRRARKGDIHDFQDH
jgi:hypothetical protein